MLFSQESALQNPGYIVVKYSYKLEISSLQEIETVVTHFIRTIPYLYLCSMQTIAHCSYNKPYPGVRLKTKPSNANNHVLPEFLNENAHKVSRLLYDTYNITIK